MQAGENTCRRIKHHCFYILGTGKRSQYNLADFGNSAGHICPGCPAFEKIDSGLGSTVMNGKLVTVIKQAATDTDADNSRSY
jgi:hypothetical protein